MSYFRERVNKQKLHSFDSYTDRKVFVPRKELDKMYNTAKGWAQASFFKSGKNVELKKLSGRKRDEGNISDHLHLTYDKLYPDELIRERPTTYTVRRSVREFVIPRQVISPERGCCR